MSRIFVTTVLLAGLTVIATSLPAGAPAKQAVKEKPVVKAPPTTPRSLVTALIAPIAWGGEEQDKNTTLLDALNRLSKQVDVPFTIDERAFKHEALTNVAATAITEVAPLPPMRTTLNKVIRSILTRIPVPSGAAYLVREDGIEITTNTFVMAEVNFARKQCPGVKGRPAAPAPPPGPGKAAKAAPQEEAQVDPLDESIERKVYVAVVSISVERQPLEEALRQMRPQANLNFAIDPGVGEKARAAVTVTLLNAPADSAMRVLMDMVELDYVWLDNIFYITTRDKAQNLRTTWPGRRGGSSVILAPAGAAGME